MTIKKYVAWTAVAAAVAALVVPKLLPRSGGEVAKAQSSPSKESPKGGNVKAPGGSALRVSTVVVARAPFAEILTSTGSLRAEESVELQAEINGKVVAINFNEGANVKAGALLVKLN